MANLLVVDDDPGMLSTLCAMLRPVHDVQSTSSALVAVAMLDHGAPIDLLLTDVKMPDLHGFALARMAALRRPKLKVLYITGHAHIPDTGDGAPLGKLLRKPIRPEDLRREVEDALTSAPR